jgi:CHAD domain-containing protein
MGWQTDTSFEELIKLMVDAEVGFVKNALDFLIAEIGYAIMVRMAGIQLSEDQKQILEALAQTSSELVMHRAKLILAYGGGKSTMQASLEAGISRGRARFWKRQFLSRGMGIFKLDTKKKELGEESNFLNNQPITKLMVDTISIQKGDDHVSVQEQLPFPQLQNTIGITLDDSLAEAGKKVWLYHFAVMLSHEQGTLLGEDIEELHDMRVATRRMRSAFDIFGPAFSPKISNHYQKGLRSVGRALGLVRDMDVILEKGNKYKDKINEEARPGMDPLLIAWKQTIDTERVKLIKHLQSEAYRKFKQDFNQLLQIPMGGKELSNSENEGISQIRDIVPILVYSRYAAVRGYESILPTASINQLHALRIEFKRFRYTLEYFKEILDVSVTKTINEIKQYQDHLGELHDADVACQLVRNFLKNWEVDQIRLPINERINPEQIVTYLAYLHAERYRLMIAFPELWLTFSRPDFRQNLAKLISLI